MFFKGDISKIRKDVDRFYTMSPKERRESHDKFAAMRRRAVMWATASGLAAALVYCLIVLCVSEVVDPMTLIIPAGLIVLVCAGRACMLFEPYKASRNRKEKANDK